MSHIRKADRFSLLGDDSSPPPLPPRRAEEEETKKKKTLKKFLRTLWALPTVAAVAMSIVALVLFSTTRTDLTQQIAAVNASLAASQATIGQLSYDLAMTAMHAVTSNITVVNSGQVRFFSTCQAGFRRGSPDFWQFYSSTYTWEDYEGKPESNFTVSQVTSSFGQTVWIISIDPPADPIVQDTASYYSGYNQECFLWLVSNQPAWIDALETTGFSDYPSLAPQSPTGIYNDPACTGSDCVMRSVTYAYIQADASPPLSYIYASVWASAADLSRAENPFVARNLHIIETLHFPIVIVPY
jgi:hypothetical protein